MFIKSIKKKNIFYTHGLTQRDQKKKKKLETMYFENNSSNRDPSGNKYQP